MINQVVLVGRLTKDPEIRMTQTGTKVCSFNLAVNRKTQVQGQPDADFINCVAWSKTAELMEQYLNKGSQIGVEGRIQTRSYDNQQKQRVYVTEVVVNSITFLEPKKQSDNSGYWPDAPAEGPHNSQDPYRSYVKNTYEEQPIQQNKVDPKKSYYQQQSQSYAQPNMVYSTGNVDEGFHSAFDLDIESDDLPF